MAVWWAEDRLSYPFHSVPCVVVVVPFRHSVLWRRQGKERALYMPGKVPPPYTKQQIINPPEKNLCLVSGEGGVGEGNFLYTLSHHNL